jgi:hypothetical protein
MDGGKLYSIGDLARRTGLAVRTIRFYSDRGIVAPAGRSPVGHRLYDAGAVGRPDLVRTQRELRLEAVNDPRRERYLTLLAVINGWPTPEKSDAGTRLVHPSPGRELRSNPLYRTVPADSLHPNVMSMA